MACEGFAVKPATGLVQGVPRAWSGLGVAGQHEAASRTATDDDDIPIKGTSGPYRAGIDRMTKVDVFTGRI
jgi:hypothetical protein